MLPAKAPVKVCLLKLFDELLQHDGYGSIKVEMRLLRKGQKEIIIDCGKQHRFVVDFIPSNTDMAKENISTS